MTRWLALSGIILLGVAAIVVSERRKVDTPLSPAAVLYLIADSEQELARMPAHFARLSDADEIAIGNELALGYADPEQQKKPQVLEVEKYLEQVGAPLASRAHRKLPYRFHYLPNPQLLNAFALPGGHIYVGEGLLAYMDSEDQLASVLGHEIEHVDHYHCSDRVQREQALRKVPFDSLVAIPIEVFQAGYTKDQELEADREGTRLAVQSGYSANGAVRLFETFQRVFNEHQSRANTPGEEVSQIAAQALEGYFRSHPLPSERISQIQNLIASEGWTPRAERDLAVAYIFWTAAAQQSLNAGHYQQAEQIVIRSLKVKPDQESGLIILAQSQFAQAKFAAAAAPYRKLLDARPSNDSLARAYAHALAAADRNGAAAEFRNWLSSVDEKPSDADILQAGLTLLAGNPAPSRALEARLQEIEDENSPLPLGELGWWHYLAGDYSLAARFLENAVQQRPGDAQLANERMWSLIETRRFADALQSSSNFYDESTRSEHLMAEAVALWQARLTNQAVGNFESAITAHPEWNNPLWVRALYSPLVASTVQEMHAEVERRQKRSAATKP